MERVLGLVLPEGTCTGTCWDAPKLLGREQRRGQHRGRCVEEKGRHHSLSEQPPLVKATLGQKTRACGEGTEQDVMHQPSEQSSSVPSPIDERGKGCHPAGQRPSGSVPLTKK